MCFQVISQSPRFGVPGSANVTFQFYAVGSFMFFHGPLLPESFATDTALKWVIIRMSRHVVLQVLETFIADLTCFWHFLARFHVDLQVFETFVADLTCFWHFVTRFHVL